jgi:hypothetical protein
MKKALIIGIDNYPTSPLQGCVNDAVAVASTLEKNGDESPNFSVKLLTSNDMNVDCRVLNQSIDELFQGSAETALFYFAGHGLINSAGAGYIVAQNGQQGAWGLSLNEVLARANKAHPNIKSSIIILDCCHAGSLGEVPSMDSTGSVSVIGDGVTILTACHRQQTAQEFNGHGLFTGILLDSLNGSAADICGRITPAAVYSHVDQILGPWDQRPIYKANVQNFIALRQVTPKISPEILRRLPDYFCAPEDVYALDPSYEPDRENIPENLRHIPVNENNARVFKELQLCNRHGLVKPVDAEHMYYAAIHSKGCALTALGAHYRNLAVAKRI